MEQVSTFGARLRALMEEQGETYLSLAQRLKMNPQTLNRYVLGQRSPKVTSAAAIAGALGVNPLWLQGYDAPKYPGLPPQVPAIPPKPEALVPILGSIRAGIPALAQQDIQGYAPADVPMPEEYFYLRVDGDSMIGAGIRPGDAVVAVDGEPLIASDDIIRARRRYAAGEKLPMTIYRDGELMEVEVPLLLPVD